MKLSCSKRLLILVGLLVVAIMAIPFRFQIRNYAQSAVQILKGRKTIEDRLVEFGPAGRGRLAESFQAIGMEYPPDSLVLLALKQEGILEIWVQNELNNLAHLKSYPILAASGSSGPKLREGDRQVPEGIYQIESLNPNSSYHLSLRLNYPNPFDLEKAKLDGRSDPGSDIMIHGKSVSIGCIAIGDPAIEELFVLAADSGIENIKVIVSPVDFRKGIEPSFRSEQPEWVPELYRRIRTEMGVLKNGKK